MRSLEQFLERILDIRKPELGRVLLMSGYLLLVIASYSITKAVRDSLFVTTIGPAQLPAMYLLIAAAMGVVSILYSRGIHRIGLYRLIRTTSLIAIANLLLLWLAFRTDSKIWFYVLYVWVSVFGAITASQFWLLATHVFNAREARRVFAWIAVGGIVGGILGGGLTNRMAHFGTESLLIVCAGMMACTLMLLEAVSRTEGVRSVIAESGKGNVPTESSRGRALFGQVRDSRHLTLMVLLLAIGVIVEAFIDYEYKFVAKQSIASKDHLTAFFGAITFYIGVFSLLFQVLASSRILKRFGVGWAILLLPSGLFAAFLALAVRPALWTAALLQLVDGGFSYSIHRSGMELLYLPIAAQTRNAVKGFIDMFVDRAGRAAGAVLLLVCTAGFALSISSLSFVGAGLAFAWIAMGLVVKQEYLQSFRQALEKKTVEPEALQPGELDGATMTTLLPLLSGDDERQALYALDLLANTNPNRWRSHINRLIHHGSRTVRARTIAVLASWNDPAIARKEFIHHPDYETARIATAGALRLHWLDLPEDHELLNSLMAHSSWAVAREAIVTAGMVGYREAVPRLIAKLADKTLRNDARQALLKFDNAVIPELVRRMTDAAESRRIRLRIPKTLALTGNQNAADALVQHLYQVDYHLSRAILKALNRMRVKSPDVFINPILIRVAISKEREQYDRLTSVYLWLQANRIDVPVFALLMRALAESLEQKRERVCRLLGLICSPGDIYSAYYNYRTKPALRPAALEFLDNILDVQLKEMVIPLLEEGFDREMPGRRRPAVQFISLEAAVSILATDEDRWLRAIVEAGVGEEYAMNEETAALSPIDKVLCLQAVDIFKYATTEMLACIASVATEADAAKDQVIFSADEISDAMYVVVSGRVRLDQSGNEILIVTSGQSFGTWALFHNQPRVMTATALEAVRLLKIRSEDFYDLLSDYDEMTPVVFRAVIERVNRLVAD